MGGVRSKYQSKETFCWLRLPVLSENISLSIEIILSPSPTGVKTAENVFSNVAVSALNVPPLTLISSRVNPWTFSVAVNVTISSGSFPDEPLATGSPLSVVTVIAISGGVPS